MRVEQTRGHSIDVEVHCSIHIQLQVDVGVLIEVEVVVQLRMAGWIPILMVFIDLLFYSVG